MPILIPMALFAFTFSISPGPVNMLTLSAGVHHGVRRSIPFILGASIGFTSLLVLVGLSAQVLAGLNPIWLKALGLIGAAIIVYFGYRIATAPPRLDASAAPDLPRFSQGALLQAANPKAWAACLAAVSLFELAGAPARLAIFVGLYFLICLIGVGSWAVLGQGIRRFLSNPERMRLFNGLVGGTLILLAGLMAADSLLQLP